MPDIEHIEIAKGSIPFSSTDKLRIFIVTVGKDTANYVQKYTLTNMDVVTTALNENKSVNFAATGKDPDKRNIVHKKDIKGKDAAEFEFKPAYDFDKAFLRKMKGLPPRKKVKPKKKTK
jgi:hypothetical protein